MRSSHYHARRPLEVLVEAGADREQLYRLLAYVHLGASVERVSEERRRKTQKRRRAEEAYLKRTPGRFRELAKEIEKLISNPEFDPRRCLPRSENKLRLIEAISEAEKYSGVRALVAEWVNLPRSIHGFASYLEIRFRKPRTQGRSIRVGMLYGRAVIMLRDYVQKATKRPHNREVADLVNGVLKEAGLPGTLTADDVKKLSRRNPSLRQPPAKLL